MNKRRVITILVLVLIPSSMLLLFYCMISENTEFSYEMNDLQNMRGAENTARYLWRDEKPEKPAEYWYSAKTFELLDASTEEKPVPYGLGSRRVGRALRSFQKETGLSYEYYEDRDYTDKVLHLVVDVNSENELVITMNWK